MGCPRLVCWTDPALSDQEMAVLFEVFGGKQSMNSFLAEYYTQSFMTLPRNNPDLFTPFVHPNDIDSILLGSDNTDNIVRRSDNYHAKFKLVKRVMMEDGEWWTRSLPGEEFPIQQIGQLFTLGYSMIVNKLQKRSPPIEYITDLFVRLFGHPINANIYITPGGDQQGFGKYYYGYWFCAFQTFPDWKAQYLLCQAL